MTKTGSAQFPFAVKNLIAPKSARPALAILIHPKADNLHRKKHTLLTISAHQNRRTHAHMYVLFLAGLPSLTNKGVVDPPGIARLLFVSTFLL